VTENEVKRDTSERDTLACARPPYGGMSRCHAVTVTGRDVTENRDSSPCGRTITVGGIEEKQAPTEGSASHEDRQAAHRAKLAADPRFAAWVAGDDDAGRERRAEERRELMRIAAQQVIDEAALGPVDPHRLAWAQQIVATHKPPAFPHPSTEPT